MLKDVSSITIFMIYMSISVIILLQWEKIKNFWWLSYKHFSMTLSLIIRFVRKTWKWYYKTLIHSLILVKWNSIKGKKQNEGSLKQTKMALLRGIDLNWTWIHNPHNKYLRNSQYFWENSNSKTLVVIKHP